MLERLEYGAVLCLSLTPWRADFPLDDPLPPDSMLEGGPREFTEGEQ
jgi:hypothetical protein